MRVRVYMRVRIMCICAARLDEVRRLDKLNDSACPSRLTFSAQVGRIATGWTPPFTFCHPWLKRNWFIADPLFWSGVYVFACSIRFALLPPPQLAHAYSYAGGHLPCAIDF